MASFRIRARASLLGIALTVLQLLPLAAQGQQEQGATGSGDDGIILVLASYNPDTQRMSRFLSEFESATNQDGAPYRIVIEDLNYKGISDAAHWCAEMDRVLERYADRQIMAIVLLGQEAWASFISRGNFPDGIPFFCSFASENGVFLPSDPVTFHPNLWEPEAVNMRGVVDAMPNAGGHLNYYDVAANIELIHSLYPDVRTIAFVSDNTYGGISLKAHFMKEMEKFPDMNIVLVDSREGELAARRSVARLPSNSAILLGTWRVGSEGEYLTNNSLADLLAANPRLPVFSITGGGIGTAAIGGYIPTYDTGAGGIADQIMEYHSGRGAHLAFSLTPNHYRFDKQKLDEFRIEEYRLPDGSKVVDRMATKLMKYETYIYVLTMLLVTLFVFLLFLYLLYRRNRKLKSVLKTRNDELTVAKERAEESDMLKTAFLANMSHEIRTPLNAIVGFSSLLGDESITARERGDYSSIVVRNSELLLTLIDDVLDISRMETGKIRFDYKEEEIVGLCRQIMETLAPQQKPGVEYLFEPATEHFMLFTDKQRLSQILINLLTNANKFTEQGSVRLAFEVQQRQNRVLFSVTDTGEGIPEQMQEKIFGRFEKLSKTKQGTGLGLAICKQIAMIFEGDIWVDAEYRQGARFVFSHPIRRSPETRGGESQPKK